MGGKNENKKVASPESFPIHLNLQFAYNLERNFVSRCTSTQACFPVIFTHVNNFSDFLFPTPDYIALPKFVCYYGIEFTPDK